MALHDDIVVQADWLVAAFAHDGYRLDYTVASFAELDRFFDQHAQPGRAHPGGRLSQHLGQLLFAIEAYVGQTLVRQVPGTAWQLNDDDPQSEIKAELVLPPATVAWPLGRARKRFRYGPVEGLACYGQSLLPGAGGFASPGSQLPVIPQVSAGQEVTAGAAAVATTSATPVTASRWWKFW